MRNAETVLEIIRERGRQGLPIERVYRHLFNPDLYLRAYARIYRNDGAMTPGATEETADGMSLAKIEAIIDALRHERYRWTPVRRVHIEKKDSKAKRPLGIPTWSDKLLQEVIRSILEAYFEPQFSDHSHGFRPGRGCHTALTEIRSNWTATVWFVEGDISQCFDSLDHEVLMSILGEKIHDNRFLRLIESLLKAGYLEDWKLNATLSGTPQGGVVSPMLSNIYLDRLDKFVEHTLVPRYNRRARRRQNNAYRRLMLGAGRLEKKGQRDEAMALRRQMRALPVLDPDDPDYRRLRYVRYADDFLLGFVGPKNETEEIKRQLGDFLSHELKLELSDAKTLITHARSDAARFLGYEVTVLYDDTKLHKGRRSLNGTVALRVPMDVIRAKCKPYMQRGKPIHRAERMNDSEFSTIAGYQWEYRGVVEYYRLAYNLHRLSTLKWVMEQSLVKTLAHKLKISVPKVYRRFGTHVSTEHGPRKVLRIEIGRTGKSPLVAQWGGISLKWDKNAVLNDRPKHVWSRSTELLERLLAQTCELCGSHKAIQVHHVRALKSLQRKGRSEKPRWVKVMAARRRKTLIVCEKCHDDIHAGRSFGATPTRSTVTS